MVVVSITRMRDGVLRSADSATVSITSSSGAVIVPTTATDPVSTGLYSYSVDGLTPGNYTTIWTFTDSGYPAEVIARPFSLDAPTAITHGVRLMEIERQVARRVGPYRRFAGGVGSTVNQFYSPALQSSLALGSYEDQFMLRRSLDMQDQLILNGNSGDRVRQVVAYDAPNGLLKNDNAWAIAPSSSPAEAVEVHYLDPEQELRPCVLDGLTRCFFWDEIQIAQTAPSMVLVADLTAVAPWISNEGQVRTAAYMTTGAVLPTRLPWWQAYRSGANILLRARGGGVGSLVLSVLRPVSSLVNDETNLVGPDDDLDVLNVNLDYAAWACVLEVWKNHPERIQPLTASGIRLTLKEAAAEFSKKSLMIAQQGPIEPGMKLDYGDSTSVVGNLAEPW